MNILYDTNIILDVFLKRQPFYKNSLELFAKAEKGDINGWLGSTTITTIHYLISKKLTKGQVPDVIKTLLSIFNISVVTRVVLESAIDSGFSDYEDAVLHQSAIHSNLDGVLTRNKKDFSKAEIPVFTPEELLAVLSEI